jgi:hypothetical protein
MGQKEFMEQKTLMDMVNDKLPRPFYHGVSRPMLKQLNLSRSALEELQKLFFRDDGSLRDDLIGEFDMGEKKAEIEFSNMDSSERRDDRRWQVPIHHHGKRKLALNLSVVYHQPFIKETQIRKNGTPAECFY